MRTPKPFTSMSQIIVRTPFGGSGVSLIVDLLMRLGDVSSSLPSCLSTMLVPSQPGAQTGYHQAITRRLGVSFGDYLRF